VNVDWLSLNEIFDFVQNGILAGRYRTKYLHLDKPLFVSRLMWVEQGTRLAFMDQTGNSAMPHLHFSLHDRDQGYSSITLDGMDGNQLHDGNDAQCCSSSNVPFP
jgi:murein DD-endopeptidase MepM/ murein hydrolase activator NlpD